MTGLIDRVEELPFEFNDAEAEQAFKEYLVEWTKEYGSIYFKEINEVYFIYRNLKQDELKMAREALKDDYDRAEFICKQCVLEPIIEDYSIDIYAGVPESLCGAILETSGFANESVVKQHLDYWEAELTKVENQLPLVIKEVFTDIPLEEIESWNMEKLAEYYVKAKWLLENLRGITLKSE
ncbi:MAG: tail chaperonin [Bacilli bacterium]